MTKLVDVIYDVAAFRVDTLEVPDSWGEEDIRENFHNPDYQDKIINSEVEDVDSDGHPSIEWR